ncbi:hypothetical protein [Burkholderia pseudomallei]|uniref:hypothetical protein n=1 Tax=Burkholderia pseudomallei TaxID=28450 RepID=UPI0018E57DAC|nr:hypothetical protein [Burkholderia pseudomallei]
MRVSMPMSFVILRWLVNENLVTRADAPPFAGASRRARRRRAAEIRADAARGTVVHFRGLRGAVQASVRGAARRGDSDAGGARRGQAIRTTKYRRRHPAALACAMTRWRRARSRNGARHHAMPTRRACAPLSHARRFHMRVAFQADNGVPSRPRHARDVPNAVARGWSGRARADSANRRIDESAIERGCDRLTARIGDSAYSAP